MGTDFILKGNICYSRKSDNIEVAENQYVICVEGRSEGVFKEIPDAYENLPYEISLYGKTDFSSVVDKMLLINCASCDCFFWKRLSIATPLRFPL